MNMAILSTLVGSDVTEPTKVIKQGWQGSAPYMTGCLINTDEVYSISSGIVIDIGKDTKTNLYSVTVEYDYQTWLRYCQLSACEIAIGDEVMSGIHIGTAYNKVLRFEYCTDEVSDFPMRTTDCELYKHDPMPVLSGEVELPELDDNGEIVVLDDDSFIIYIDEDTTDGDEIE